MAWLFRSRYLTVALFFLALVAVGFTMFMLGKPLEYQLRKEIENLTKAGKYADVEATFKQLDAREPGAITSKDKIAWATAALRADHPGAARKILDRWKEESGDSIDGWLLVLDLDRVLGDLDLLTSDIESLLQSDRIVPTSALLTSATLGILTDLDQAEVRKRLNRWVESEPDEPLAQAALLLRYTTNPMPEDPPRDLRLQQARKLLEHFPSNTSARLVLVESLLNAGLYDEAVATLDEWPANLKNSTAWHRLNGRRLQDVNREPAFAIPELQKVLKQMPQDWKTRYRLSRSFMASGNAEEARKEALRMTETRELLDPVTLEPILKQSFPKGRPPELKTLLELLDRLELKSFADAWRKWRQAQEMLNYRF